MSFKERFKTRPLGAALFFASVIIAAAMAGLLGFEWTQRQALQTQASQRVDSLTAHAFMLDRVFLRFTAYLDGFLNSRTPPSIDDLRTSLDVLSSKVDVLRDSPGSAWLMQDPQVAQAVQQMLAYTKRADAALAGPEINTSELRELLGDLKAFTAESLALGSAADMQGSRLMEQQSRSLLDQNLQITWLTLGQLLLLILVALGLSWHNKVQRQEKLALSALNQQLQKAQQEAVSANRGKSLFLANMSHELRTPFNGVMGLLGLLKTTSLSSEQTELVNIANDSASHLLQLLDDILDMSALEQGKITLRVETMHLPSFLDQIENTFRPLAVQKSLQFEMQNAHNLDCWIAADATRLRQILFNLVSNALKFTERGHVRLSVGTRTEPTGPAWLELRVQDSGIGMSQEAVGQLFQRFFQVDAGLSRRFPGIGLGLQISLALAQRMGGDITVQSALLQGSTFELRLPLLLRPKPSEAAKPIVQRAAPEHLANATRILVAEDHAVNQKFMALLLKRMGFDATFCENGKTALEAIVQAPYDLVLMDIHMPVMDGLTATRAIRGLPGPKAKIPVIALTADVLPEARQQAHAAGVNAFITKPVRQEELAAAIAQCLAQTREDALAWAAGPGQGYLRAKYTPPTTSAMPASASCENDSPNSAQATMAVHGGTR